MSGIVPEILRHWVKKAEADTKTPAERSAPSEERVQTLEREVADLRWVNAVLKAAAVLFASELEHGPGRLTWRLAYPPVGHTPVERP
jgi:transposase